MALHFYNYIHFQETIGFEPNTFISWTYYRKCPEASGISKPQSCTSFETIYFCDLWSNEVSSCGIFYKQIHVLHSFKRKISKCFSLVDKKLLSSYWSHSVVLSRKPYLQKLQLIKREGLKWCCVPIFEKFAEQLLRLKFSL